MDEIGNFTLIEMLGNGTGSFNESEEEYVVPMENSANQLDADIMRLQYHVRTLDLYVTPTILTLGGLANLFAGILMASKPLRKTVCSVYFLAILVSNEIFLAVRFHDWMTEMGLSLYGIVGGWCQFTTFAGKASDFLSLWYAVCLAADRYFHTSRPDRHAEVCSTWRARLLVIGLSIISTVIFLNTSLTVGVFYIPPPVTRPYCHTLPMFRKTMSKLSHADIVVNSIVGLGCLIALTGLMLTQKAQAFREDVEFWVRKRRSGPRGHHRHPVQTQTSNNSTGCDIQEDYDITSGQTTASIIYIVLFLLFNLPLQGYRVKQMFKAFVSSSKPSVRPFLIIQILKFVKLVNFSLTLFILIIFYSGIRKTLQSKCSVCVRWRMCRKHRTHTSIEMAADERHVIECGNSKSSIEESSTVEFVSHESAYV